MHLFRRFLPGGLIAAAIAVSGAAPAGATTLIRAGLDELVAGSGTIVVGEVVESHSYWNADGTFILTDVSVVATEVLKGDPKDRALTVTLLGGTVGDLTTLIVGGADLSPGSSYVLFLGKQDLPGVKGIRTVGHHSQGVFDIRMAGDGLRAVSQAVGHPLVPDARGNVEAPGGVNGIPLNTMTRSVREIAARQQGSRQEVN